jgi:hypothetical protein
MTNTKEEILKTEFSQVFAQKMSNAMLLSFYKYGAVAEAYPEKIDAIGSLMKRLRKYAETGNIEYLVDVANFSMIEFMHPRHPKAHYKAEDSSASPGRVSLLSGLKTHEDNRGNDLSKGFQADNNKSAIANFRTAHGDKLLGGDDAD